MRQKDIFLQTEADAWYERNRQACADQDFGLDSIGSTVLDIARSRDAKEVPLKILEIGCGEGRRLAWLKQQVEVVAYGIDPSAKAIDEAIKRGVEAVQGTADNLPYEDDQFDIVIFGFCLYLCDTQDLFLIAQQADRVLKSDAWLIIQDFHSVTPMRRDYHHKAGIYSHKMDFRKLFDWHPDYVCHAHRIVHHVTRLLSDDPQEWVATSLLRKRSKDE